MPFSSEYAYDDAVLTPFIFFFCRADYLFIDAAMLFAFSPFSPDLRLC